MMYGLFCWYLNRWKQLLGLDINNIITADDHTLGNMVTTADTIEVMDMEFLWYLGLLDCIVVHVP